MIPAVTKIYYYPVDEWIEVVDVLPFPPPTWEYGIEGCGPLDLLASTGFANFYLDNSAANSHGVAGYYSIGLLGHPMMIITGDYDYELLLHFDNDADDESTDELIPTTETGGIIYPAHVTPAIGSGCVQLADAVDNLIENPSIEVDTARWAAGGTNIIERSTDVAKIGGRSLKGTYIDNPTYFQYGSLTLTDTPHTGSAWVWVPAAYDGTDLKLQFLNYASGVLTHGDVDMTKRDQWQDVYCYITPDAGDLVGALRLREIGDAPSAGQFLHMDAIQVEATPYPTPYCDGSLGTGHSWAGAAHDSVSSRTKTQLAHTIDLPAQWTIGFWYIPVMLESDAPSGTAHTLFHWYGDGSNSISLRVHSNDYLFFTWVAQATVDYMPFESNQLARYTPIHYIMTYDGTNINTYQNKNLILSQAPTQPAFTTTPSVLYMGSNTSHNLHANGWEDEFTVLGYALTDEEVAALYARTVGGVESVKFIGRVAAIRPSAGLFEDPTVEIEVHDWMGYCIGQELGIIPVQETKKANEALTTALAKFPIQPIATDFDIGVQIFLLIFDTESPKSTMASFFQKLCRNELGRIYTKGDGTLRFEKQGARALITTPDFELDGIMTEFVVSYEWADIYNIVQAMITPVEASLLPDVLLWDEKVAEYFGGVIPSIAAGETLVLNCPFTDPALHTRISAINVVDPIVNIEFGSVADFESNDMIGDLVWSQEIGGNATIVTMTNNHATATGYLNDLQIYGRALYTYGSQTLESRDQTSIESGIGERRFFLRLEEIADGATALAFAVMVRDAYSDPFLRAGRINFLANQNLELLVDAINIEPSTRFTAIEEVTTISKDFYVNRVKYTSRGQWLWVDVLADPVRT